MTTTSTTTTVTFEQIARCHRCIDLENMLPFYKVESESGNGQEYKVATIRKNGKWYVTCTCPAGLKGVPCKHRKWAKAAAQEYKELLKAEAEAQARIDAQKGIQTERERLLKELGVGYASANVDNATLARMIECNKKPAKNNHPCIQARPFSIL
jgi:hypothetical protein